MKSRHRHLVRWVACLAAVGILAWGTAAQAKPLKLAEIAEMSTYVVCVQGCDGLLGSGSYTEYESYYECMVACGKAPRTWEKNGIYPVDDTDLFLAYLEYQSAQSKVPLVCYADADETIVIPAALCAAEVCEGLKQVVQCDEEACGADPDVHLDCQEADQPGGPACFPGDTRPLNCPDVVCEAKPDRTFPNCADADGDGLAYWLEKWLKYDDNDPDNPGSLCNDAMPCAGQKTVVNPGTPEEKVEYEPGAFDKVCEYSTDVGLGFCKNRQCAGACTAFHLSLAAQDDQEVIVHVYYDYTPVPARALDLYIEYDQAALTLAEARRLAPLKLENKQLATTHLADGALRLSVFDTASTSPIPTGPIVELVFQRHTEQATLVAFTKDDALQAKSVAPLQGSQTIQSQLTDDSVWGPAVLVPELSQVTTVMRLWYGFDAVSEPLSYSNVPSGGEVCALYAPCVNEPDEKQKALAVARLEEMQEGLLFGGETIEGLSGGAVYLDGGADHLRMPVHYREPLVATAQSFSICTWFYSEGNSLNEAKKTPQVVFQHESFDERTRFGLALKETGGDLLRLVFFVGDMLSVAPKPVEVTVADGLLKRTWHHAGFTLDATTGKVELYFDGDRVGDYTFEQPPAAVSCPQFFGGTNLVLHQEGDVLGGHPPELVYVAKEKSNLYRIYRMDPSGLAEVELIGDGEFSYRDPDYSPLVDRIVYSSNASGSFEIWMADGSGENRQQLTAGFGSEELGVSARRPRWAPDASAIVFDSDAYDVLAEDNDFARVRHLYHIGYDPLANQVKMEAGDGSVFVQLDKACDDVVSCTESDACVKGACTGVPVSCAEFDSDCTVGICDEGTGTCGPQNQTNGTPCDDGDICSGHDECADGFCDGKFDLCEACFGGDSGQGCNDGDACSVSTVCILAQGQLVCMGEQKSCEEELGPDGIPCDDQDVCTGSDACVAGMCIGALNLCGSCLGLEPGAACDDGDACTVETTCLEMSGLLVCQGKPMDCHELDTQCAVGACDLGTGQCVAMGIKEGTPCDDGEPCTEQDGCAGVFCKGKGINMCGDTPAFCEPPASNDKMNDAIPLTLQADTITVMGWVSPAGETDWYAVALQKGQLLTVESRPHCGSTLDTQIGVYQPDGVAQLAVADDGGQGSFTLIQDAEVAVSGVHYIGLTAYSASGTGTYLLDVTAIVPPPCATDLDCVCSQLACETAGPLAGKCIPAMAEEVEPNDFSDQAMPVAVGSKYKGKFSVEGATDWYAAELSVDIPVNIGTESFCGEAADPKVTVFDETGWSVLAADSGSGGGGHALIKAFLAPEGGTYLVRVQDEQMMGGSYVLFLEDARCKADADCGCVDQKCTGSPDAPGQCVPLLNAPESAAPDAPPVPLKIDQRLHAAVEEPGDVDKFAISLAPGKYDFDTLSYCGSETDTEMELYAPGDQLVASDEDSGDEFFAAVKGFTVPQAAVYVIEVSGYGAAMGDYIVRVRSAKGQ